MIFKNTSGQKIHIYAYDSTTGAPKTGDAANITGHVSLDGTANAIDDTNPTEVDATNMPGIYAFDLTQAETNCDAFALYAKSSTSNIRIEPIIGFTTPTNLKSAIDNYSATRGLSGTALPNAAADAAGGLPISDAGGLDLDVRLNHLQADYTATEKTAIDGSMQTTGYTSPPSVVAIRQEIDSNSTKLANAVPTVATIQSGLALDATVAKAASDFNATQKASLNAATPSVTVSDKTGFSLSAAGVSAVQSGLSTLTAQQVWEYATRSLTTFGSLAADIWANATRTLTSISDSAGITTLLSRIASAMTITGGKVDVNDKTGFALTSAYDPAKTAAQAATALSNTTWTDTKAGYIDAAISTVGGGAAPTAAAIRAEMDSNSTKLAAILEDTGTTLPVLIAGGTAGTGAIEYDLPNIYETGTTTPIADVDVWITTDVAGMNVIASGKTDAYGTCKFYLDAGLIYVWCQKSGYNFTNPTAETVS